MNKENFDTKNIMNVADKYHKGIVSMAEAATIANVTIYEMMEYCRREQIRPIEPSQEDLDKEHSEAKEIFENLKKK